MIAQITTIPFSELDFSVNPEIESLEAHYPKMLNPELKAFIGFGQDTQRDNAELAEMSLEEQREGYHAFCRDLAEERLDHLSKEDFVIPEQPHITLRHYFLHDPFAENLILFFHGGGFVLGDLDSHDDLCQELAQRTHTEVIAVNYRLAPEHQFPTAVEDALEAYHYVRRQFPQKRIILCGDSAGGTLCAGISGYCIQNHLSIPDAQILIYPFLGGNVRAGSFQQHRNAPMFTLADAKMYTQLYMGETVPVNDVRSTPLALDDFSKVPPTICLVCEIDPLANDGIIYCNKIPHYQKLHVAKGLTHGTWRLFRHIEQINDCWDWLGEEYHNLQRYFAQ